MPSLSKVIALILIYYFVFSRRKEILNLMNPRPTYDEKILREASVNRAFRKASEAFNSPIIPILYLRSLCCRSELRLGMPWRKCFKKPTIEWLCGRLAVSLTYLSQIRYNR